MDAHGNVVLSTDIFGRFDRVEVIAEHAGTFYGQPMTAGQAYVVAGGGRNLVAAASGTFYGQKMTAGHIYRLAGNKGGGLGDGGPAAGARVDDPAGVAIAPSGAILIADGTRIREIHP